MDIAFKKLYTSEKNYYLLTGGRGSLKTSNVMEFVIEMCNMQPNRGILYTRYTMTSAEKSIIPEFRIVCDRLGLTHNFDFTKTTAKHKTNGSFVYFSGIKTSSGDQTATLKGIANIDTWIIEEGEDFKDEKTFDTIDDSIRVVGKQNRVIWIQNPTSKEHFIYKRWIEPKNKQIEVEGFRVTVSDVDEVEHIHTTYHLGMAKGYLSDKFLNKMFGFRKAAMKLDDIQKHKSHYYYNYIGGWLEKAEGVIYEDWTEGEFDESVPYAFGLDYGYFPDPTAIIKVGIDQKRKIIYLEEKFYETQSTTEQVKQAVLGSLDDLEDLIVTDTNEKRLTRALKDMGLNAILAWKGSKSVKDGILGILDYKLVVCGSSPNLKIELNNYIWNDKKASIPVKGYDHLLDPMRYVYQKIVNNRQGSDMVEVGEVDRTLYPDDLDINNIEGWIDYSDGLSH